MIDQSASAQQSPFLASQLSTVNPDNQQGQSPNLNQGFSQGYINPAPQPVRGDYPPPYNDEAPPPRPADPPTQPARTSPLAHLDTGLLNRMARDLRSNIPSDPTFMAHVGALWRATIAHELSNPDRIAADKAALDAQAQAATDKAQADLAARHEAEKAAVPPADEAASAALDARHEAEKRTLDFQKAQADLAAKQAEEAKQFAARQLEERNALASQFVPAPAA